MTKILIDTNYFISLYSSHEDIIERLGDIKNIESDLIMSDQIFEEFLRNRDTQLLNIIGEIKSSLNPYSFSLIRKFSHFKKNEDSMKIQKNNIKILIKDLQEMLDKPEKDPIFIEFIKIYESSDVFKLKRDDEIILKAHKRLLIGNPPKSKEKNSIGDEIIWELLINNINDDLIILSSDGTYKRHKTFLINEYKEKTGKKLFIEEKLTKAMKILGKEASKATINYERSQQLPPRSSFTIDRTTVNFPGRVTFTDTSLNVPTSWLWDFGDGSFSELQHPVHQYVKRGVFNVTLQVTNEAGTDISDKQQILVIGYQ